MPAKYAGKFFLAHFKGAISTSKIQTFRVQPKGAGFALTESEELLGQCQPTDVDFGPDGAMYFADWGEGWERAAKGRIYRLAGQSLLNSAQVLAANPTELAAYRAGKTQLKGWFVGQVMRATKGKGNPGVVNRLLEREIERLETGD